MSKRGTSLRRNRENVDANELRWIGELVSRRKFPEALSLLNTALPRKKAPILSSRYISLVGDIEFHQSKFQDAVRTYETAVQSALIDPVHWLRPRIGKIQALLKIPDVLSAKSEAEKALRIAVEKINDFDEQIRFANEYLASGVQLEAPHVPIRISVVAWRLGFIFLHEGALDEAKTFFNEATKRSPGGANRARQGLAQVALLKGDYKQAYIRAINAIRHGNFRAKTIPAWKILITARRRMGGWRIPDRLIVALFEQAESRTVLIRTSMTVIKELRKNDMRQWVEMTERLMPYVDGPRRFSLKRDALKCLLASAKVKPDNWEEIHDKASELLELGGNYLSPKDWLAARKAWVTSGLYLSDQDTLAWLDSPVWLEGPHCDKFILSARHGVALACMNAGRHDLARQFLLANLADTTEDVHHVRNRSRWTLARMESMLGNHALAAQYYQQYRAPKWRHQKQAELLWLRENLLAGNTNIPASTYASIKNSIGHDGSPFVRMDLARWLLKFPEGDLRAHGQWVFEQAVTDATTAFWAQTSPKMAMSYLFQTTRRQVCDFLDDNAVVLFWERLTPEKRDWLWTEELTFWEYLGYVFTAYVRTNRWMAAQAFARHWLNDAASPMEGLPYIGVPYGVQLMRRGAQTEAFEIFERMTRSAPSHALCARAWYWLALREWKRGNYDKAHQYAEKIRLAQGTRIGLLEEWELDAKALFILADMDAQGIDAAAAKNYSSEQLARWHGVLLRNLDQINIGG